MIFLFLWHIVKISIKIHVRWLETYTFLSCISNCLLCFLNRSFVTTCKRMIFILLKIFKSLNSNHFSSSIHFRIFQYSFLIYVYVKIEFINKHEIVVAYEVTLCAWYFPTPRFQQFSYLNLVFARKPNKL